MLLWEPSLQSLPQDDQVWYALSSTLHLLLKIEVSEVLHTYFALFIFAKVPWTPGDEGIVVPCLFPLPATANLLCFHLEFPAEIQPNTGGRIANSSKFAWKVPPSREPP